MTSTRFVEFKESHKTLAPAATRLRASDDDEIIEVSVYLKPKTPIDAAALPVDPTARRAKMHELRAAAHETDISALQEFARANDLRVTSVEAGRRLVKISGTAARLKAAFKIDLGHYSHGGKEFRAFEGSIQLPDDLLPSVESILGLDTQPIADPRLVSAAALAPRAITAHWPNQMGQLYNFPPGLNGAAQCIAIIELGGGYNTADTASAFQQMGLPVPTVTWVSVDGGQNQPGQPADGEVALDIQVAGGVAPGSKIVVYFAPNTLQGFADAISQAAHDSANHPSVISISWGTAEDNWAASGVQAMQTMNTAIQDAGTLGVSVFVASGDHLGTDNLANGKANVDFPAASPYSIGCGGTTIDTSGNTITSEVVWNDGADGWGTGGGISDYAGVPAYQSGLTLPPSVNGGRKGRGVPDVAASASAASGYYIVLNGATQTIGGTSGVAPFWAGLTALANQAASPRTAGFFLPTLYANSWPMREITSGNNKPVNSNLGYAAGPVWNACTGLGVPDGGAVVNLLARPARPLTRLSATSWTNDPHIRVYYQGQNGPTLEQCWDGRWTSGATLPAAIASSSFSTVSWLDSGQIHIRVYYLDGNNVIQEQCWDGNGWTKGSTLPATRAGSALASICWLDGNGQIHIRVYYEDGGNVIREQCWDGSNGWTTGSTLPTTRSGSALAAMGWLDNGQIHIRVYYQDANNAIQEQCWDGSNGWTTGSTLPTAGQASALAAIGWLDSGQIHIRVYYQDGGNVIQEQCWDGGNGWTKGSTLPAAVSGTSLAAVDWFDGSQIHLRVYYQATPNLIREATYDGNGWGTGAGNIPVA